MMRYRRTRAATVEATPVTMGKSQNDHVSHEFGSGSLTILCSLPPLTHQKMVEQRHQEPVGAVGGQSRGCQV